MRLFPVPDLKIILASSADFLMFSARAAMDDKDERRVREFRQSLIDDTSEIKASDRIQRCCSIAICCWRLEEDHLVAEWLARSVQEVAGFEDMFGNELRDVAIVAAFISDFEQALYIAKQPDDVWRYVALENIAHLAARRKDYTNMFASLGEMRRDYMWFDAVGKCLGEISSSEGLSAYDQLLDMIEHSAQLAKRKGSTDLRRAIVALVRNGKEEDADRLFQHADELDGDYARKDIVEIFANVDPRRARAYLDGIKDVDCKRDAVATLKAAL